MAVGKDKARLTLAAFAVGRLLNEREPWTLKILFVPDPGSTDRKIAIDLLASKKELLSASMAKGWQRTFMNRLVDQGWVEETTIGEEKALAYVITEEGVPAFIKIIHEIVEEPRTSSTIKWLVFPSRYSPPEWVALDDDADEGEEEEEEGVAPPEEGSSTAILLMKSVESVLRITMDTADKVELLRESQKNISTRVGELTEKVEIASGRAHNVFKSVMELQATVVRLHQDMSAVPQFVRDAVPVLMEVENLMASTGRKIDVMNTIHALKSQVEVCHSALTTITAKSSELVSGMHLVVDAVGEMEHGPRTARSSTAGVPGLPEDADSQGKGAA